MGTAEESSRISSFSILTHPCDISLPIEAGSLVPCIPYVGFDSPIHKGPNTAGGVVSLLMIFLLENNKN